MNEQIIITTTAKKLTLEEVQAREAEYARSDEVKALEAQEAKNEE